MAITTLNAIIDKIRKLTGSANQYQITDSQIQDYINSFYLYDFPAQFRSLKLKDKYTFDTIQGIDTYPFDSEHYTTIEMPCYCMKREMQLFNDPWPFYGLNFNWQQQVNFANGNGTAGPYTATLPGAPLIRSVNNDPGLVSNPVLTFPASRVQNLLITANTSTTTLNVSDDGQGNLYEFTSQATGTGQPFRLAGPIGTINYFTGDISVTFSQSIPSASPFASQNPNTSSNPIQIQYNPASLSIPLYVLFFQNQFTLRPVPDRGYTIEAVAYRQPTQALNATGGAGKPELSEWWETLAFGASKKIYQDRLDMDGVNMMDKFLKDSYQLNFTRTHAQLGKQRVATIYADQVSGTSSNGWGFGGGGLV